MLRGVIIFFLLAAPAAASDVEVCDRLLHSHHVGESETRDHGSGLVSFVEWFSFPLGGGFHSGSRLNIVSCRTTKSVSISLASQHVADENLRLRDDFDVAEVIQERFERALVSEQVYTLEELASEMSIISPRVITQQLSEQPCACALVYPDRGRFAEPFDLAEVRQ